MPALPVRRAVMLGGALIREVGLKVRADGALTPIYAIDRQDAISAN